jgi:hypothetical protein
MSPAWFAKAAVERLDSKAMVNKVFFMIIYP